MHATIDRFGRVVIPKNMRDELGLKAGEAIEMETRNEAIEIRPSKQKGGLMRKKGALVFTGKLLGSQEDTVKTARENRDRSILKGLRA